MVENKFNGSRITSEKHTPGPVPVATHEPMPPPLHTVSVKYNSKDEEQRFEKVKQETAAKDNKPECTSLDEIAAKAKVLKYKEDGSASNSPKKTNSKETEHVKEKSNSVNALTRTTTNRTKTSTNFPLPNLVNVIVGIFLLFAITCQVFKFRFPLLFGPAGDAAQLTITSVKKGFVCRVAFVCIYATAVYLYLV